MSKRNYTHLTLVLDGSGSMGSSSSTVKRSAIAFLEAQKQVEGEMTVSVAILPHTPARHFQSIDEAISMVRGYYASGGTPLFDTVGDSIKEVAGRILRLADENQPEKILFAIVTDGGDTGHRRYKVTDIKEMVDYYEGTYDWEFLYIGSNQDAYTVGREFGIKAGKALSFASSQAGLEQAFSAVSGAVTRYRKDGAPHANQFFTGEDHDFQRALGAASAPVREESSW